MSRARKRARAGLEGVSLALLALLLNGCWAGHTVPLSSFEKTHESLRWAYEPGGQIGNEFILMLWPIHNRVHDLFPGRGCVIVREGPAGCMEGGPWRPEWALDLQTGRLTSGRPIDRKRIYASGTWREGQGTTIRVDHDIGLWISPECDELRVGRAGEPAERMTSVLKDKSRSALDTSVHYVRTDDVLVVGMFSGYVLCIDLTKIPGLIPARKQSSAAPEASRSHCQPIRLGDVPPSGEPRTENGK
jgi:hypothetical protein